MLAKGNTGRYLKYAVGEIILVVVGILIALQINDWNTDRENKLLRKSYYLQILQDLEKDENLMSRGNVLTDSFLVRLQSYRETFRENEMTLWGAAIEIGNVFSSGTIQGWNFETNSNTITTLINTGDIKLIPLPIRNKILDVKYKQAGLMDYIKSQIMVISNASMNTQKLYGGADLPTRIGKQPKLIEYFGDEGIALRSLLELEALLNEQSILLKNAKERSENLIQDMESLKEVLVAELED